MHPYLLLFTKGHKIFLERMTNYLEIITSFIKDGSGTLEKSPEISGTFFFMPKDYPEELRNLNIPEYMVLVYI